MNKDVHLDAEIAQAEADVKTAEAEHGPNDIRVSYRLDALAKLLRKQGVRVLDAANIEARAKAIRVKLNTGAISTLTPQSHDISEAVRTASKRNEEERRKRTYIKVGSIVVVSLIAAKLILSPPTGAHEAMQRILSKIAEASPLRTIIKTYDSGKSLINNMEDATKKHNEEIEKYNGSDDNENNGK